MWKLMSELAAITDIFGTGDGHWIKRHKMINEVPDVSCSDGICTIKYEFPGLDKKDITVTLEDKNVLAVKDGEEEQKYCKIRLNKDYDMGKAKVVMKHGLLQIDVPLGEEAKPKDIPIE